MLLTHILLRAAELRSDKKKLKTKTKILNFRYNRLNLK